MMLVVCHDAGGAEIISSYLQKNPSDCLYVLAGPAITIFKKKLAVKQTSLKTAILQSKSLLCGTSWQSDLELEAIDLARQHNQHSIAYLDHWTNYRERFERHNQTILPDEIWVTDAHAKQIAQKHFPGLVIQQKGNPYLDDIACIGKQKKCNQGLLSKGLHILYICEPIEEHALKQHGNSHHWGYTEQDAMSFFIDNLSIFDKPITKIVIRPHPSEKIDKYIGIEKKFDLPVIISKNSLIDDIQWSDVVVGCESMAMMAALIAQKKVISIIPPGGKPCALPHSEILHLQKILGCKAKVSL